MRARTHARTNKHTHTPPPLPTHPPPSLTLAAIAARCRAVCRVRGVVLLLLPREQLLLARLLLLVLGKVLACVGGMGVGWWVGGGHRRGARC